MLGLNLLIKPVWILTENIIQDEIGHETFGLFSALLSLVLILSVFSNLGINHFVTNTLVKDKSKYQEMLSIFFGFRLFSLLAFPLLCVSAGWLIGYTVSELKCLFIIALSQGLLQFVLLFRAKFQAFQDFIIDSFSSILDRLILLSIIVVLFLSQQITLDNFLYARLLAFLFTFLILIFILRKKYGAIKISFSLKKLKPVIYKTLPFTLMTLLYAFNERIDMAMVERLYSKHEAGLYAGAYRWYDGFMMVVWLLSPMFFSKFSSNEKTQHSSLLKSGKLLMAIPVIGIGSLLLVNNEFIFFLFENSSTKEVLEMSSILSVLMISYLFNGIFVLYGTYLNAAGFVSKVNWLVAGSALTNVILNYIFIPKFGAIASAYTTALSTFILSIGYLFLIKNKIKIDSRILIKLLALCGLLISFSYIIYQNLDLHWAIYIGCVSLAFIAIFFLLGLYKPFKDAITQG